MIAKNPSNAQGQKRNRRTSVFKQMASAGLTPSSVVVMPDGTIKIEFDAAGAAGAANDNEWDKVLTDDDR